MPNRIIKESITTDERFGQVSLFAELLYYHLLVICDDYGRADARLPQLRARLFPWRLQRITETMIDQALDELARVGLLVRYVVRGVPYLAILNWEGNQQRRSRSPKYPAPEEALETSPNGSKAPESAQQEAPLPAAPSAPAMDLSWLPNELDDSWLFGEQSSSKAPPKIFPSLSLPEEQYGQQREQPKERSAFAQDAADAQRSLGQEAPPIHEASFLQKAGEHWAEDSSIGSSQTAPSQVPSSQPSSQPFPSEAPSSQVAASEAQSSQSSQVLSSQSSQAPSSQSSQVLSSQSSQAPKPQKRKEDPLFVALLEAIYERPYQEISLTASERGRCNKAVSQLRAIGASPEEIHRRAAFYRLHFPHAALTPTALVANWNHCAGPPPPRSSPAQIRAREALQRAIDAVAAARMQDEEEEADIIDLDEEWGDPFERKGLPS